MSAPSSRRRCWKPFPSTGDAALIIVISGAGGVGKGTLVARLLERDPGLWLSRSWTTRERRPAEAADAYTFVDDATFDEAVRAGRFLEHAEFLGHRYGTPWPDAPRGRDVVLEIDVQGAAQVRERHPRSLIVFLEAPDRAEQVRRLRQRGDPEPSVRLRVAKADEEHAAAVALGAHLVVNDDLEQAVRTVASLVASARERADATR